MAYRTSAFSTAIHRSTLVAWRPRMVAVLNGRRNRRSAIVRSFCLMNRRRDGGEPPPWNQRQGVMGYHPPLGMAALIGIQLQTDFPLPSVVLRAGIVQCDMGLPTDPGEGRPWILADQWRLTAEDASWQRWAAKAIRHKARVLATGFTLLGPNSTTGFTLLGPKMVVQHKEVSFPAREYPDHAESPNKNGSAAST